MCNNSIPCQNQSNLSYCIILNLNFKKEIGIEKTGFCTFVKGVTKSYDLVVENKQKKLLHIMSIDYLFLPPVIMTMDAKNKLLSKVAYFVFGF